MSDLNQEIDDVLEDLNQEIDDILAEMTSIKKIQMAAIQIEAKLGELERHEVETDLLDKKWVDFCIACYDLMKRGSAVKTTPVSPDAALRDNNFRAALYLALSSRELANAPVLILAAMNKYRKQRDIDEIAVIRLLVMTKFNPDVQDSLGNTALHYLAYFDYFPFSSPRGVRLLLKAGANPNIQDRNGDTPLSLLARSKSGTMHSMQTAYFLARRGANPHIEANDGLSALDILKQVEATNPNENRAVLIDALERIEA